MNEYTKDYSMYKLKEIRSVDNMFDYSIIFNNKAIGVLNLNVSEDNVFIRQIRMFEPFKRRGHARNIINYLMSEYKRKLVFCVATNSESAILFWKRILEEKEYKHIRGEIYELIS